MPSVILRTMVKALLPVMALASVFLLLRGHDEPGGGFIGGLMLATGLVGYAVVFGPAAARAVLHLSPRWLIGGGLVLAFLSGWIGTVAAGDPFMTSRGHWVKINVFGEGYVKLGPSLFFDIGVYLLVAGACIVFVFHLMESDERLTVAAEAGEEEGA